MLTSIRMASSSSIWKSDLPCKRCLPYSSKTRQRTTLLCRVDHLPAAAPRSSSHSIHHAYLAENMTEKTQVPPLRALWEIWELEMVAQLSSATCKRYRSVF